MLAAAPFARTTGYGGVAGPVRLQNALIIVREFTTAGLPLGVALAAIVNADHESGLNHMAIGDKGKSVGLFQLHENGGGKGMSVADRQNPQLNARRIISEYVAARSRTSGRDLSKGGASIPAPSLDGALSNGATVAQMAGLFGFHVERPWYLEQALTERAARADKLLPAVARLPANGLQGLGAAIAAGGTSIGTAAGQITGAGLPLAQAARSSRIPWLIVGGVVILGGVVLLRRA